MKTEVYLRMILTMVSDECGESIEDIRSACRRTELVQCRTMYCAIAWQLLHPTLRCIAAPINRCVTCVQGMIIKHPDITDRFYVALHGRILRRATQEIFKGL